MNIPVYNVAFASAAAVASGMSAALRSSGKNTNVIAFAGDGGTVDIGIQSLSGALERGTDFLYICYDNEAYGNTGMQRSGSTPLGAITTTTPAGKTDTKKDLDRIVAAHNPPYMASACAAFPQDLFRKVHEGAQYPRPDFHPCPRTMPPGWRYSSEKTVEMGKLAVKTGIWTLWERNMGNSPSTARQRPQLQKPSRGAVPWRAGTVQGDFTQGDRGDTATG
jgi:pyruvate ferredoxin oxidoreductase beta subunit